MLDKRANPLYQAQDILSRRDHSEEELRVKLRRKHFSAQQIETTIISLRRAGLVNDAAFARRYAESMLRAKAVGPRWLTVKLRQKRIAPAIIKQVIDGTYAGGAEEKIAKKAAKKWKKEHAKQAEDKQRLMRFLLSRGFSQDAILSALTPSP